MFGYVCFLCLLLKAQVFAEDTIPVVENDVVLHYHPRFGFDEENQVNLRNGQRENGADSAGRNPPPPPHYYVETPDPNGRVVFQIDQSERNIFEQLGVLGPVLPERNNRNNGRDRNNGNNRNNGSGGNASNNNTNSANENRRNNRPNRRPQQEEQP